MDIRQNLLGLDSGEGPVGRDSTLGEQASKTHPSLLLIPVRECLLHDCYLNTVFG